MPDPVPRSPSNVAASVRRSSSVSALGHAAKATRTKRSRPPSSSAAGASSAAGGSNAPPPKRRDVSEPGEEPKAKGAAPMSTGVESRPQSTSAAPSSPPSAHVASPDEQASPQPKALARHQHEVRHRLAPEDYVWQGNVPGSAIQDALQEVGKNYAQVKKNVTKWRRSAKRGSKPQLHYISCKVDTEVLHLRGIGCGANHGFSLLPQPTQTRHETVKQTTTSPSPTGRRSVASPRPARTPPTPSPSPASAGPSASPEPKKQRYSDGQPRGARPDGLPPPPPMRIPRFPPVCPSHNCPPKVRAAPKDPKKRNPDRKAKRQNTEGYLHHRQTFYWK